MRLVIGRKYEQEFKSAFLLIRGCTALNGYSADGELEDGSAVISYGMNSYRYSSNIENAQFEGAENSDDETKQGFTIWGATWFSKLRGGQGVESADAIWLDFMKNLADGYHNKYAILTYEPQAGERIQLSEVEGIARRVLMAFHPAFYKENNANHRPTVTVVEASAENQEEETQDIYGISLRLSLNCGGQSEYIIGKIYFEKHFSEMRPMPRQNALLMDASLNDLQVRGGRRQQGGATQGFNSNVQSNLTARDTQTRDNALRGLGECIERSISGQDNFLNYLIMGDERDTETVTRLLERTTDSTHELQCDGVKVLCISHLQWKSWAFDVSINDMKAFRFTFDLDQVLTVKCLNCYKLTEDGLHREHDILVMKNDVLLKGNEGEGPKVVHLPNTRVDGFELSDEELAMIRDNSVFADHVTLRSCKLDAMGIRGERGCKRLRCASQLFSVYYDAEGRVTDKPEKAKREEVLCKDCRYPEKMYYNPLADTRDETISLVMDVNTMTLVRKEVAKVCPWCKRTYVGQEKQCNTCTTANRVVFAVPKSDDDPIHKDIEYAKALYKQYARVLPVFLRARKCFSKKYCFEDDGVVIFVIGKRRYRFDKINAKPVGMVKSAVRIMQQS